MAIGRKKLTQEQADQVVALAAQGLPAVKIAEQVQGASVQQIGGIISHARRTGMLPRPDGTILAEPRPVAIEQQREPVVTPSAPVTSPEVQMPLPSPAPQADEPGWQSPGGSPDGFTHPTQIVEYKIERIEPKDGVLEVSGVFPTEIDLGNKYGSGTYRIWKREGTKAPVFRDMVLAPTFGEPRFPSRRGEARGPRPGGFPPFRPPADEGDMEGRFQRPSLPQRPYMPSQMAVQPYPDRTMDMAQRGLSAQESIAVTAVNKLAEINEKQLDRLEKERERAAEPASTITDLLKEQQAAAERRANEEIRRREEERKRDREEWERRENEREAAHRREMDRIKLENDARIAAERETRQTLMELETKKLELIREEARAREATLKGELEKMRTDYKEERDSFREQLKENEEKTEEQLSEMQASVKEELQKERETLKREHELKELHLANEQKLKEELLRLREEMIKGQQSEDISKVLGQLVQGVERTIREVVDLKKIEAVSAEERLAKIGQQGAPAHPAPGANLTKLPAHPVRPAAPVEPAAQMGGNGQQAAAPLVVPGAQAAAPAGGEEGETLETMISRLAGDQQFQTMAKEWAQQIEIGNDASVFANNFMEMLHDDGSPNIARTRKALSMFLTAMSTRKWAEMYDLLQSAIPKNLQPIFESPHAEVFYDQFKMMVVESVRDYWKAYFAAKKQEQDEQARLQAQGGQAQEAPAEPLVEVASRPTQAPPASGDEPQMEVTVQAG